MIKCWAIYHRTNELSANMAKCFIGDTYKDIENQIKAWHVRLNNVEIIDVAKTVYENDEDEE